MRRQNTKLTEGQAGISITTRGQIYLKFKPSIQDIPYVIKFNQNNELVLRPATIDDTKNVVKIMPRLDVVLIPKRYEEKIKEGVYSFEINDRTITIY